MPFEALEKRIQGLEEQVETLEELSEYEGIYYGTIITELYEILTERIRKAISPSS